MYSRVLIFLMGAAYIYYQVVAADVYTGELMLESNITLNSQTTLSILNATTNLQVVISQNVTQGTYTVTILQTEMVAECLIIGTTTNCNCSSGYTWSNNVCYNYSCCTETMCTANISYLIPLCVPKVNVQIKGSVSLNSSTWDSSKTTQLQNAFSGLNGFQYLNITSQRQSAADFAVPVNVKCTTSKLQEIVTALQNSLRAVVQVSTSGMVTIMPKYNAVCYESSPVLTCTFEESMDSSGWNLTAMNQRFDLYTGSVVQLNYSCATLYYNSCIALTLQKVTGAWSGMYECRFTKGSVSHTATAQLGVALLPDVIIVNVSPLTVDCLQSNNITVTTTVSQSTENYTVWWSYNGVDTPLTNTSNNDSLVYRFNTTISCKETNNAQYFNVTFRNTVGQTRSQRVDIPVIYEGSPSCGMDVTGGWPKTPVGATVINRTCPDGRVGYKSRTCSSSGGWQDVFDYCVNQQLNNVLNQADDFLKGLGTSQTMAMNIFQGLQNSSSASTSSTADISASINVLNVMASASNNIVLKDDILPSFINAASNMVNNNWDGINTSTVQSMSSTYLQSVEGLVKNIRVNKSNGVNSTNLELKFCSSSECNVSVFDIGVNISKTDGILKTVAVKNLTNKLRNMNYSNMVPTGLVLSATLENNSDSSLEIRLNFPNKLNQTKPLCVFWNTTVGDWSNAGCTVNSSDENNTLCKCNHLTPFSVLMSKGDIPEFNSLDMITNVGLGVSICSLLIFLAIESLVWSAVVRTNLAHFRHTAMVNIAMFLLLADCSFLASTRPDILSDSWCLVLTICKHLFYLAMFCWMLCMSIMLVHQLVFVFSPLRKRTFMFFSSIVGYVCPVLIVGSSYVYCTYTKTRYYDKTACWLVYDRLLEGSMHTFLLPVGTVILINLFSMIIVILTLLKSSVPDGSKANDKETAKSILKVVVFLTPVFGVTWIIGFFQLTLMFDDPMYNAVHFCFTILNSFQGLFILLTGCFAEHKVREEVFKAIIKKSKGKSDSTKNLISTTYIKEK